ncbi:hypothetical protein BC826DRAFT_1023827, partial [Russula brevipes]
MSQPLLIDRTAAFLMHAIGIARMCHLAHCVKSTTHWAGECLSPCLGREPHTTHG